MTQKIRNGKIDAVFKSALFRGDDLELSSKFLSSILGRKVKIKSIKNTELPIDNVKNRKQTVDVLVELYGGHIIHLELNAYYKYWLHYRNFSYFTAIFSNYSRKKPQKPEDGKEYTDEELYGDYDENKYFVNIDISYKVPKRPELVDYDLGAVQDINLKYIRNFVRP